MDTYFFIKYFHDGFEDYFDKIKECGATFTFDLEDSIQVINSVEKTTELIRLYRKILVDLLKETNQILNFPLAIRLNNPNSLEFVSDLEMLRLVKEVKWRRIIIPKVESAENLLDSINNLIENEVLFDGIGALIESKVGLANLNEIITVQPYLKTVIFGHADYNLDLGYFPFIHQSDEIYWKVVESIVEKLSSTEITFVNSPCLYLSNDQLFLTSLQRLETLKSKNKGQLTLTLRQSLLCKSHSKNDKRTCILDSTPRVTKNRLDQAKRVISLFTENNNGKSFSISNDNYLVSPHEYLIACQIVRDFENHES